MYAGAAARLMDGRSGASSLTILVRVLALAALAAALGGCSGGGGGGSGAQPPASQPSQSAPTAIPAPSPIAQAPTPAPTPAVALSGIAIQGPMMDTKVTAFAIDPATGNNLASLGSTTTICADGSFTVTISPHSGPIRLITSGGSFPSEMDSATIATPGPISLLLPGAGASVSGLSLNPLSTFADSRTVGIVRAGGSFAAALTAAKSRIEGIYGLSSDPGTLIPNYVSAGNDGANLGLILGALINEDQSLCPGAPGGLVTALAADISDGVFDGKASGSAVPYCGGTLPAIAGTAAFQDALSGLQQLQQVTRAFAFGGKGNILSANKLADLALGGSTAYPPAPLAGIVEAIAQAAPAAANTFAPPAQTAVMTTPRYDTPGVRLPNGRFLIPGGLNGPSFLSSIDLYDPVSNSFLNPNPATLTSPRANETVTLLNNGKVLIAGGADSDTTWTNTTDIYDPATNTVARGPSMNVAREGATATLLADGRVFIAGGRKLDFLASTELYDPVSNRFLSPDPANLTVAREDAAAVLLPNGKVLVAGGRDASLSALASTELYDPASNSVSAGPSMAVARTFARAVLLPNGKVLIAGGVGPGNAILASTELYDPASNSFTIPNPATMNVPRYFETATLLPNGKVLLAGGYGALGSNPLSSTELYDPSGNSFASATASMTATRGLASAGLLPNGKVIIAGGVSGDGSTVAATTDLYSP
jgi:hypothetical protein